MFIGATHVGKKHTENQDCIIHRCLSDDQTASVIAVADGISGSAFGASVARWLLDKRLSEDDIFDPAKASTERQVEEYLHELRESFRNEFDDLPEMLSSGASLSLAAFKQSEVHCFWVGDCPIYETVALSEGYETGL